VGAAIGDDDGGTVTGGAARGALARLRSRPWGTDLKAGVVLGVESVPDGLASGVLAGVNPHAGLYGYLYGIVGAALITSSTLIADQATGAMSLVVADADLGSRPDPERALWTLAVLTGVVMIAAGLLRGGALLRFVPSSVMTGFVTAVGVNIVLGQLGDFTGAETSGANRVMRTLDLLLHPWRVDLMTLLVGVVTLVLIVGLQRTRLGALGLVVAMAVGSFLAVLLGSLADADVAVVGDIAAVPRSLPLPALPSLGDVAYLALPAVSLAFIGLVQGAAVSAAVPNPDGSPSVASRDFIGQGVGNVVSGVFRGMPVGGSMSASSLVATAGARTRVSLGFAGGVMALVVLVLADVVALVALPAIAALLIVVGAGAVRPARVQSVMRTGTVQTVVLVLTFVLTLLVPVQYAVLAGVALAIVLHVVEQSNRVRVTRLDLDAEGRVLQGEPPDTVPGGEVLVLQPYGSLFFASAPTFQALLPRVDERSRHAVVVLRLRGVDQIGLTLIDVLRGYARELQSRDGVLKLVVDNRQVLHQMEAEGLVGLVGPDHVYLGTEWLGETTRRARTDGLRLLAGSDPADGEA
jgi:SulP family sulfate permease